MSVYRQVPAARVSISLGKVFILFIFIGSFLIPSSVFAQVQGENFDKALENLVRELEEGVYGDKDVTQPRKIAVLPPVSPFGSGPFRLGAYIRSTVSIRLIQGRKFIVLDRNTLDKLITELEFQETELVAPESRKKIGKFLGAEAVLATTVFDTGTYVKVSATLHDVSSAVSLGASDVRIDRETIPPFLLVGAVTMSEPEPVSDISNRDRQDEPVKPEQRSSGNGSAPFIQHVYETLFSVVVKVSPPEALLKIDGVLVEPEVPGTYSIEKSSGQYVLEVTSPGYRGVTSTVSLMDGGYMSRQSNARTQIVERELSFELEKKVAQVKLDIVDSSGLPFKGNHQIFIDGDLLTSYFRESFPVEPGEHSLLVACENYYDVEREFSVRDRDNVTLTVRLSAIPVEPEAGAEFINSLGMALTFIPRGSFSMGSPDYESGRMDDEGPVHEVQLTNGFFMATKEVTQSQYYRVMGGEKPSLYQRNKPAAGISWEDAVSFCEKLSTLENRTYRLPTEAEWEYACRGGESKVNLSNLSQKAWYRYNSNGMTQNVGQKNPNPWGLYDMLGNVKEWCQDFYGPYFSSSRKDPKGPAHGTYRVLRGGSWFSSAESLRPAYRADRADAPYTMVGFRIVSDQ